VSDFRETLKTEIAKRAFKRVEGIRELLDRLGIVDFYIAGGVLTAERFSDIDLFPAGGQLFSSAYAYNDDIYNIPTEVLSFTPNAITIKFADQVVQLCKYKHSTLGHLIESFDFTHIQVGARVTNGQVVETYFTDDFILAKALENSKYVGSEYPLSSLVRLLKYYKRGAISRPAGIGAIFGIVKDIVVRGFRDYEDFKDQIDAVDLGLLPDELEKLDGNKLFELFEALRRDK